MLQKVLILIAILLFLLPITLYIVQFNGGLSEDQNIWGAFGSFVGGVFSSFGFIIIWLTFKQQQKQINENNAADINMWLESDGEANVYLFIVNSGKGVAKEVNLTLVEGDHHYYHGNSEKKISDYLYFKSNNGFTLSNQQEIVLLIGNPIYDKGITSKKKSAKSIKDVDRIIINVMYKKYYNKTVSQDFVLDLTTYWQGYPLTRRGLDIKKVQYLRKVSEKLEDLVDKISK